MSVITARRAGPYRVISGAGAGAGAALAMMLVMVGLRFAANLPTIPELMINPIVARLGGQAFSDLLDRFYYVGRPLLFATIIEGTLLLGVALGVLYAWMARPDPQTGKRLAIFNTTWAGVLYGLLIGFLLNTVFLVLIDQQPFADRAFGPGLDSPLPLWLGLMAMALVYGVVLQWLLPPVSVGIVDQEPLLTPDVESADRRQLLRVAGGTLLAIFGGAVLVFGGTWLNQGGLTSPVSRVGGNNTDNSEVEFDVDATEVPGDTPTPESVAQASPATPKPDTPEPLPTETNTPQPQSVPTEESLPTPEATDTPQPPAPTDTPVPTNTAVPVPAIKVREITPTDSFYHVSKNFFDPSPSADGWKLEIKGLVNNPYSLTYKELTALPAVTVTTGMMCISNPVGGGLIGSTDWKGVKLADLLKKAGPKKGVTKVAMRAADDYSDSITYQKALDTDVVLVWEMGGAPLTSQHGFPARLLVPGIYGMKHLKWITSIELVDKDFKGYWQQPAQGWSDPAPVNTMSRIDFPSDGVLDMKAHDFSGVAFAGDRSISKVEVSTDGGDTWQEAYVKPPKSQTSWVVWGYRWTPPKPGTYKVKVRATDGKGNLQTDKRAEPYPNGATGYHTITYKVTK